MDKIFRRADILLPQNVDMTKWSVVACDQFSSQPEYWAALDAAVGSAPSTLRLMLPEAFLDTRDQFAEAERIDRAMAEYIDAGVFREWKDSFVYLERTLPGGAASIRRGLLGVLDLEAYDYGADSTSPIRATEGTIESRLPPRVRIRAGAPLEMPHVMVFIDDPSDNIMSTLSGKRDTLPQLYDFDLSAGGGHLRGWQVTGTDADTVDAAIANLSDPEALRATYGGAAPVIFAMGDGNHSLATAKKCWEQLKTGLTEEQRKTHPARYSLVELVNIHDAAITFEPIHRCLFGTDPAAFLRESKEVFTERYRDGESAHDIRIVTADGEETVSVPGLSIGELIGAAERFCVNYVNRHGGAIDYIHNDETALAMGRQTGNAALLLPKMEKDELFPSVVRSGSFPKKSFSIGRAEEKRYYLECRKIK